MREPLPHWVTEAMLRLEQNGEEAWLVGGCVRDRLLGRPVHDYDLTVSCLPDRTAWLFRDHRLVEDGRKHGTIGVVTEGGVLEMTTFRTDGEYRDHRHPESVQFVPDLREDLARRDFTINAMAYSAELPGRTPGPLRRTGGSCRPSAALCGRPLPAVPGGRPAHPAVCPVCLGAGVPGGGGHPPGGRGTCRGGGSCVPGADHCRVGKIPCRIPLCRGAGTAALVGGRLSRPGAASGRMESGPLPGTFSGEPGPAAGRRPLGGAAWVSPRWDGGLGRSRPGTVRPAAAARKPGAPLAGGGGLSGPASSGVLPGGVAAVGR